MNKPSRRSTVNEILLHRMQNPIEGDFTEDERDYINDEFCNPGVSLDEITVLVSLRSIFEETSGESLSLWDTMMRAVLYQVDIINSERKRKTKQQIGF